MNAIPQEEKKWRRRNDAQTLIDAEAIHKDRKRYQEALIGLSEMKSEKLDQANATIDAYKKLLKEKSQKQKK